MPRRQEKSDNQTMGCVRHWLLIAGAALLVCSSSGHDTQNALLLHQHQHRKLFWGWVFLADLVHCGPLRKHCKDSHSSDGGGSESDSGSDYSSESYNNNNNDGNSSIESQAGTTQSASRRVFQALVFAAVGIAAALTVAAIGLGQRRSSVDRHPLSGVVARRMALFGQFCHADSLLCDRPPRHLEPTLGKDDFGNGALV